MDKMIKQSIDTRKNALKANFEIDIGTQKKIDALFSEIEKLGEKYKDVGEFETEFAKSPLNQKYLDLFTEIATKGAAKGAVVGAAQSVAEQALQNVIPTQAAAHQKVHDEIQGIPVVGDVVDVAQKASYGVHLGKLFGKKKK